MGLIYDSADSKNVIAALSGNLSIARATVDHTQHACNRLLGALGNGELSGEGYNAIGMLFSQAVLPTVKETRHQLDSVEKDLATYTWEDSKVSRFGVLMEDQLATQLEATRRQRDATERLMETNEALAKATAAVPLMGDALRLANVRLETVLNQLEKDVQDLEDRLTALRHFECRPDRTPTSTKRRASMTSRGYWTRRRAAGSDAPEPRGRHAGRTHEIAEEISRGGKAFEGPASYDGTWVELPDGTRIGRRQKSASGGPTIDIKPPQGDVVKVHLPKGWGK